MTAQSTTAQVSESRFTMRLLHPKHWLMWLLLGFLKLVILLPFGFQVGFGKLVGTMGYFLMRRRRHIAKINVDLCFPDKSEQERNTIVLNTFKSVGISVFETLMAWWTPDSRLQNLCTIEGLEHLQNAVAEGKGVILLTGHMASLEIGSRFLLAHHPFAVMYKRHRNELIEHVVHKARVAHCKIILQQDDIRGMLRTLKQKKAVWYAPDQDLGMNRSVLAPFLGVPTATIMAPSRFAKMTGALVIPYFPTRLQGGKGYKVTISPALDNFPSDDEVANATRINAVIGEHVRKFPDQYLWLHRRFKTRPAGEPDFYS